MKNLITFFIIFCSLAIHQLYADINIQVDNCIFQAPEQGSYVETYLLIPGKDIEFVKNESGNWQASAEISIIFQQGEEISAFDKYILNSKEVANQEDINFNLVDLKRFPLEAGNYSMEIKVKDIASNKEANYSSNITIEKASPKIQISDIVLLEDYKASEEENIYTKNGIEMSPYVLNYYPSNFNRLMFYTEFYNTDKVLADPNYLVTYSLVYHTTDKIPLNLRKFKKQEAAPVNVLLGELNIEDLPSGNYDLIIDVRNKQNEQLASKKIMIQRNKKVNPESLENISEVNLSGSFTEELDAKKLNYYLGGLKPIAGDNEVRYIKNLIKSNDETLKRQFIYNFWLAKDNEYPSLAFAKYVEKLDYINNEYKTSLNFGHDTDRGHVFLKYGQPNNMQVNHMDPNALPYEIWRYYTVGTQSNVEFVFFSPERGSNEFVLLHSTVMGELSDPLWENQVFQNSSNKKDPFDNNNSIDHFGTRTNDF